MRGDYQRTIMIWFIFTSMDIGQSTLFPFPWYMGVLTLSGLPWFNNDDIQHLEETYINKKFSDCLVGVFGVDSEKIG